jgi:hypothetical protein
MMAPLLLIFTISLVYNSITHIKWTSTYAIAAYVFAILAIACLYLTEKKLFENMSAKPAKLRMSPEANLYIIGISYSFFPASLGPFLIMFGVAVPFKDLYQLMGISYVAMIAWTVHWYIKYIGSKSQSGADNEHRGDMGTLYSAKWTRMVRHKYPLGILHVINGAILFFMGIIISLTPESFNNLCRSIMQSSHLPSDTIPSYLHLLTLMRIVLATITALLGVIGIAGGFGLLLGKTWAKMVLLIAGALNLFFLPLGLPLGLYTLWVILRKEPQLKLPG